MALYPVIMCGGGGTRLWPASRPARPKQFLALTGDVTLFQETALRVAPLARNGGRLLVVAGARHRDIVKEQLEEVSLEADLLLEPEPRDSAPAMAAAAAFIERRDPQAIAAFVASDHYIPDHQAFRDAIVRAADAARDGRIVTLGIRPAEPSCAYGYIEPSGPGLTPVRRFVEKPDRAAAERYILSGFLWNSGNFVVRATTLLGELATYVPGLVEVVTEALPLEGQEMLGASFASAQRISIDYAVMEKTRDACVLEADFQWSDLGAWDAVAASGAGARGLSLQEDCAGCLIRAPEGVFVAALGLRNVAIIVEEGAVLVTDLTRAQELKHLVDRIPNHLR